MIPFNFDYYCDNELNHILYIESNIFHTYCYSEKGRQIFDKEHCLAVELVDFIFKLRDGKINV